MNVELAKRAVACKHWRWMQGMAVAPSEDYREARIDALVWGHHFNLTVVPTENGPVYAVCPHYGHEHYDSFPQPFSLPDLDDPATLGCLLALVREAKGQPHWQPYVAFYGGEATWWLEQPSQFRQTSHESYASVLVAALESVKGD